MIFAEEEATSGCIPLRMLQAHAAENNPMPETLKLKPDWEFYVREWREGRLIYVTARVPAGLLVGYMVMMIRRHPHYRDKKIAVDDLHWLDPSQRSQGIGKKLIAYAEERARERGATIFSMRCKAASPHGHIFEALGYQLSDHVYIKDLSK